MFISYRPLAANDRIESPVAPLVSPWVQPQLIHGDEDRGGSALAHHDIFIQTPGRVVVLVFWYTN